MDDVPAGLPGTPRPRRPPPSLAVWCRSRLALVLSAAILVLGAALALLVAVLTLFRARRLYAEGLACRLARLGFRLHGVRLVEHHSGPMPQKQVVFIANHWSLLDPFVVIALGLPNCRYFMSGFLRVVLPFAVIASLAGTFWTPRQRYPVKRRRLFRHAAAVLRRTGESVFLTPEGQACWVFNKGASHLATSLGVPIVPLVIAIEPAVDPGPLFGGEGFDVRPGRIDIYFKPPINTAGWTVAEVEQNRDRLRALYLGWARELAAGRDAGPSPSPTG
jgi:1-acyl-sn-glycerol-3-phosphate acyltransferase